MVGSATFTLKLKLPLRVRTVSHFMLRGLVNTRSVSGAFFKLPLMLQFSFVFAAFVAAGDSMATTAAKLNNNLFMLKNLGCFCVIL